MGWNRFYSAYGLGHGVVIDAVCGRFIIDSLVMRKCDAASKTGVFTKLRIQSECTIILGCSGPMLTL